MKQSWTVRGAYANWTMTIAAAAPDDADEPDLPRWPETNFARVAGHFTDSINCYEAVRDRDRVW